jgi:hypothetical protein
MHPSLLAHGDGLREVELPNSEVVAEWDTAALAVPRQGRSHVPASSSWSSSCSSSRLVCNGTSVHGSMLAGRLVSARGPASLLSSRTPKLPRSEHLTNGLEVPWTGVSTIQLCGPDSLVRVLEVQQTKSTRCLGLSLSQHSEGGHGDAHDAAMQRCTPWRRGVSLACCWRRERPLRGANVGADAVPILLQADARCSPHLTGMGRAVPATLASRRAPVHGSRRAVRHGRCCNG